MILVQMQVVVVPHSSAVEVRHMQHLGEGSPAMAASVAWSRRTKELV